MIFFFHHNRERRAVSKALCFPLLGTSYRYFLLHSSSKSYKCVCCCFNVGSIADKVLESIRAKHIGITVAQERPGGLPPERERDGPTAARENVLLCFGEDVAIEVLSF